MCTLLHSDKYVLKEKLNWTHFEVFKRNKSEWRTNQLRTANEGTYRKQNLLIEIGDRKCLRFIAFQSTKIIYLWIKFCDNGEFLAFLVNTKWKKSNHQCTKKVFRLYLLIVSNTKEMSQLEIINTLFFSLNILQAKGDVRT